MALRWRLLRSVDYLKDLPTSALSTLSTKAVWKELPADNLLIEAGQDTPHGVFVLARGDVEVFRKREERLRVHLARLSATTSFGELGTITGKPGSASVVTLTPAIVAEIPGQHFLEMITEFPQIALNILQRMVGRVRALDDEIVRLSLADHLLERLYHNIHPWTS